MVFSVHSVVPSPPELVLGSRCQVADVLNHIVMVETVGGVNTQTVLLAAAFSAAAHAT